MKMRRTLSRLAVGCAAALLARNAMAGGFIEIGDAVFDANSNEITNPWAGMPEGTRFTYFSEGVDECNVILVEVLPRAFSNTSRW